MEDKQSARAAAQLYPQVQRCGENKKVSDLRSQEPSGTVVRLADMLERLDGMMAEHPPHEQSQRFGNKAFRDFFDAVTTRAPELVRDVLTGSDVDGGAVVELAPYLCGSLGNSTRLDYGTGHELSFCIFLMCLHELQLFEERDYAFLPLVIFNRYLKLCRSFQQRYSLEPAGSHGVWSLDDYQFLCFLWGSAQLLDHKEIKPISVVDKNLVKREADEYLYCAAIDYVHVCKTGPFFEHSPTLNNVAGVVSWHKVNGGMFKMFEVEVLGKVPIMQHVMFGNIFPAP